jgi:hypothetical protein
LKLRHETQGSTVLAFNSFRVKEAPMSAYNGFSPWTQLSEQEWVLDPDRKHDEKVKDRYLSKMKCPSCSGPLERKPGMFASSKTGHMDGLVCESCNALWDDPGNSFLEAHAKATKESSPAMYTASVVKKEVGSDFRRGVKWRVDVLVEHTATGAKASDYFEGFYTDAQIETKASAMAHEIQADLARARGLPYPGSLEVGAWVYPEGAGPKPIIINGKGERYDQDVVTYEALVERVYGALPADGHAVTVTYKGLDKFGSLTAGQRVWVESGMVFNVVDTSNA